MGEAFTGVFRRHRLEMVLVAAFLVLAPLLARAVVGALAPALRGLGLGPLVAYLDGSGAFTDVGWEVASSQGLVDSTRSMYDTIDVLAPLIGMSAYDVGAHTHPPTSVVMWLPLGYLPYGWWLAFFVCASAVMLALTLRVMAVPAWLAYPLVALMSITPVGMFVLTTTYPLMALVLALAWRFRDVPWVAGPAYGVLAAARGVAGVLLVYPLVRRQWRTVVVALGLLVVLAGIATILEPTAISEFLREGRAAIEYLSSQGYLFSPFALLARWGVPTWLGYLGALLVLVLGVFLKRNLFWLLVWFSLAISPLGWVHSIAGALPLFVLMWRSGRLGQILTLVVATATFALFDTAPVTANLAWLVTLVATGIAVVACPIAVEGGRAPRDGASEGVGG